MRIWLVAIGEPVSLELNGTDRLHRAGYFAHFLADHGHDVVWWTSAFDHFHKKYISSDDATLCLNECLSIKLLRGCGYSSNLSISRIMDHRKIAAKFNKLSQQEQPPDLILSAFPTIELSLAAVRFGKMNKTPVVLDMRDMWPDIFVDMAPKYLQFLVKLLIWPMRREAYAACAGATAITGITEQFVDWGLKRGERARSGMDRAFPMGYISRAPADDRGSLAERFWDDQNVKCDSESFTVCLVSTISRHADFKTVIHAARKLMASGRSVRFVICGTGDLLDYYRKLSAEDSNVVFPGWVDAAQIYVLMRRSAIGLDPLPDRYDFLATINNKAIEYLSAALPIVSSPDKGVLSDLLREHECGVSYPQGDVEGLVNLIAGFCDDRSILQRMSQNAVRLFQESFTAEKVYTEMMEHLLMIAENCKDDF